MKKLILLLIVLSYSSVKAQYHDLIVTNDGDSIICKITMVNDQNIFYNYKSKKTEYSRIVYLGLVKFYNKGGKAIIVNKTDVGENATHLSTSTSKTYTIGTNNISAGDELIIAQNHWYTGLGLSILGSAITLLSVTSGDQAFLIGGGALGLAGTIMIAESWSHIGKAGRILNRSSNKKLPSEIISSSGEAKPTQRRETNRRIKTSEVRVGDILYFEVGNFNEKLEAEVIETIGAKFELKYSKKGAIKTKKMHGRLLYTKGTDGKFYPLAK